SLFDDAQVGASARKAYIALYDKVKNMTAGELDRKSWKANASHGANIVKLAFDGNKKTRWTTGGEQKPGQWFALDLGRVAAVAAIELDYEASGSDGPKGYKVFTSMDGVAWTGPVAEGEAPPKRVAIKLSGTPVGRWIRIEQTGTKQGLYWSIHELHVRSGTDPAKLEAVVKKVEQLRAK
ncbi:MAG: discoidin domain-containing protein, partial [Verrucomicrobia bacterium]|nr:discoidin domain-containing protein [Verrucomicrobiota bacterium]